MARATEALMDAQIDVDRPVAFAPRRLGHMNLFVGNLARSMEFYQNICGLEDVGRSDATGVGFLSNGNTHHDVGCLVATGKGLVGPDGHVQVPKERGHAAGLNHLGWEMESEWHLTEAYHRAMDAGLKIHRTCDHAITRSVYVFDPDGFLHEIYADTVRDWRGLFRDRGLDGLTTGWTPGEFPPSREPRYEAQPNYRHVSNARYHAIRLEGVTLLARNFARMRDFYINVMGMTPLFEFSDPRIVGLGGTAGGTDLVLIEARAGVPAGMHHFSLLKGQPDTLSANPDSNPNSFEPEVALNLPFKRSVLIRDPDGMLVELFDSRADGRANALRGAQDLTYYAF